MLTLSAILYCAAALATIGLHSALVAGAPWGHMTMGGQITGRLPRRMRIASLSQGLLLVWFCLVVLHRARLWEAPLAPDASWAIWLVVAVSALSLVANSITPSIPERYFGVPATAGMLLGSLGVALFSWE